MKKVRVAVNGYGVIGKRIADAVTVQEDMELIGISDVVSDWRIQVAVEKGYPVYAATPEAAEAMRAAGIQVAGTLDQLLQQVDIVADATPKKVASANLERYRAAGVKSIFQGVKNTASRVIRSSHRQIMLLRLDGMQRASCPATRPALYGRLARYKRQVY